MEAEAEEVEALSAGAGAEACGGASGRGAAAEEGASFFASFPASRLGHAVPGTALCSLISTFVESTACLHFPGTTSPASGRSSVKEEEEEEVKGRDDEEEDDDAFSFLILLR